ncbi:sensor histidine kinase [Amycolatopsis sp. NPDC059021]|uniref:sensor histidine kinase n=1 Tax=Amycolatopsis sp. NPDC059021 TaxID=3346704 RepID=UPI00367163D3
MAKELRTRGRRKRQAAANGVSGGAVEPRAFPSGLDRISEGPEPLVIVAVHGAVCAGIAVLAALPALAQAASWFAKVLGLGYLAGLVAVQLTCLGRPGGRRHGVPALAAQAVLGFLPILQLGVAWSVLSGFFAGGLLLVAKPILAIPGVLAVAGGVGALTGFTGQAGTAAPTGPAAALATAVIALVVFGLTWSARLAAERSETRSELTRRAVAEERMRFSRDAHDLLGLSLSAITLKGELTHRLIVDQPQRAMEELAELLDMSRKALADVRSVAAGYRDLSLDDECLAAIGVLRAAGVEVFVDRGPVELSPPVATTLATVLREGVTNVIRHSKASRCRLTLRASGTAAWLELVNDGVPEEPETPCAGAGCGLRNLRHRVGALGGELTADVRPDGSHRLFARVPLSAFEVRSHLG